jgi:hypothetical protein
MLARRLPRLEREFAFAELLGTRHESWKPVAVAEHSSDEPPVGEVQLRADTAPGQLKTARASQLSEQFNELRQPKNSERPF